MTSNRGNSERREDDDPLPIERRKPAADSPESTGEPMPVAGPSSPDSPPEKITRYSADSAVRSPVQLFSDIFSDFWTGRELAWRLFLRNLRGLYRQTLLGLFWAFLPPIANTAIWVFLKEAKFFESGPMEVNSTVFILTGMILWQAFIDAFQMPLEVLNKNRNMISKLNFPREALLLVGMGEVVFDLLIRLLLLIPAFLIFGGSFHASMLLAPLAIGGLILFGTAMGLLIMPLGSLYQDVGRFVGMVLPLWMIMTPVIYLPIQDYPGSLLNWVNPASPLLIVARDWILVGSTSHFEVAMIFGIVSVPLGLLGLAVYRISMPVLVERMSA